MTTGKSGRKRGGKIHWIIGERWKRIKERKK
jgi:hypothetical protein